MKRKIQFVLTSAILLGATYGLMAAAPQPAAKSLVPVDQTSISAPVDSTTTAAPVADTQPIDTTPAPTTVDTTQSTTTAPVDTPTPTPAPVQPQNLSVQNYSGAQSFVMVNADGSNAN
jgi:hypothetical protein